LNSSKYNIKKTNFFLGILLPVFFTYSYLLISGYIEGDQYYYRIFYNELASTKAFDVISVGLIKVGSVEPISLYVLWLGAQLGIDKDIYISFLNVLLLSLIYIFCRSNRVGLIPMFLLLTNFYVIVLMTGAERLKIGYIILLLAAISNGRKSRILLGASFMAHLQNAILLPSIVLAQNADSIRRLLKAGKFKVKFISAIIGMAILAAVFFGIFNEAIVKKVISNISHEARDPQLTNLILLTVVGFLATRNRWRMIVALLPLYPAVLILGGQRINMIAVTLAIYFLIKEKQLSHPLVLLLLFYFSLKSIPFIVNIAKYGSGFG